MKETKEQKKNRVLKILSQLGRIYPDLRCALQFETPFQLLAATILSAQCTDRQVNRITPALFARFPDPASMAAASLQEIEELIHSTGFYRNKAKNIHGAAQTIVRRHQGKVPGTLEELVQLPGVGRKTGNVVLGYGFGIPGLTVDTHMIRLNQRLGLTCHPDPVKIEFELMPLVPQPDWTRYSTLIITHGRRRCFARKPDCGNCEIRNLCPQRGVRRGTVPGKSKGNHDEN